MDSRDRKDFYEGNEAIQFAKARLRQIRVDAAKWEEEYEDIETSERWLMDYPQSHLQGGGPPRLRKIKATVSK